MATNCPECRAPPTEFHNDYKRAQISCRCCGLVLRDSYDYVAGHKIYFPFQGKILEKN